MDIKGYTFAYCPAEKGLWQQSELDDDNVNLNQEKRRAGSELCEDCRALDLRKALSTDEESLNNLKGNGIFIANVGTRYRQQLHTGCDLCQLLSISYFEHKVGNDDDSDHLRAFSFRYHFKGIDPYNPSNGLVFRRVNGSIFLAVVPSTYHYGHNFTGSLGDRYWSLGNHAQLHGFAMCGIREEQPEDALTVRTIPAHFDADLAGQWLKYCQQHHNSLCQQHGLRIKGLKLIDCNSNTLWDASEQVPYVALSYVWGDQSNCNENSPVSKGQLPSKISRVIFDAISVTKALGYQYLWIDKFCINQEDPIIRHEQIKRMDSIYENAVLTIIAAAGQDAHYGLPGVGLRAKKEQKTAKHLDMDIVSSMQDPHNSILSSKWASRGWTFQEATLSRRRLVFTEEQMYFECNAMNCFESISAPLDAMHTRDKRSFQPCFRVGLFGRGTWPSFGRFDVQNMNQNSIFILFLGYVEDYCSRDLSYDQDSLNAFAGIIRSFRMRKNPVFQLCGVPYPGEAQTGKRSAYFETGLAWKHKRTCWDVIQPPRRRVDFPSWTWAGWAGAIESYEELLSSTGNPFFAMAATDCCRLCFELNSNTVLNLDTLHGMKLSEDKSPRIIRLEARSIPYKTIFYDEKLESWTVFGASASLFLSRGPATPSQFFEELKEGNRWYFPYLGQTPRRAMILVLESYENYFLRAGLFVIDGWPPGLEKGHYTTFRIA